MDASPGNHGMDPYPYDISSVGELLKRKRKARAIKACFPCRHRKVKCDGNLPCASCVSRNHPDLCRVAPVSHASSPGAHVATLGSPGSQSRAPTSPRHSRGESGAQMYGYVLLSHIYDRMLIALFRNGNNQAGLNEFDSISALLPNRDALAAVEDMDITIRRLEKIEQEISTLKRDLIQRRRERDIRSASDVQTPRSQSIAGPGESSMRDGSQAIHGARFFEETTGATIYLGSHSDPPLALGCRAGGDAIDGALLDQLMPRTYPFSDLWRPAVRAEEICQALPGDSDILRYVYRIHDLLPLSIE